MKTKLISGFTGKRFDIPVSGKSSFVPFVGKLKNRIRSKRKNQKGILPGRLNLFKLIKQGFVFQNQALPLIQE